MHPIIGIDLGTTNSAVAIFEGTKPVLIPNREGGQITPSVVARTKEGDWLVGETAKRQAIANPANTVTSIKRKMGTNHRVTLEGVTFTPEEISAMILQRLKRDAEHYLEEEVEDAVITVPAYFEDAQRQATKNAGVVAGLKVRRIINEPTAAALAYGIERDMDQCVLVYDLGGGTFDVSILEISEGVFQVLATKGDNTLGGDDFDALLVEHLVDEFGHAEDIDLSTDPATVQLLKTNAEKAKKTLSEERGVTVAIPFIAQKNKQPVHLHVTVTRAQFESMIEPLVARTLTLTQGALDDAGLERDDLDQLLLVGGSTYIPMVRRKLEELLGLAPSSSIDPDRVVALGASIQGSILAGMTSDVVLVDVTPLSLGVETTGGIMTTIIERNTSIPSTVKRVFSTSEDDQTSVDVHVLQGERPLAKDNVSLGTFTLKDILRAPRGFPEIEVTFDIDADGILEVEAIDLGTGARQQITLSGTTRLTKDEINRMVADAATYACVDENRLQFAAVLNFAETLLYYGDRILKYGTKMFTDEQFGALQAAMEPVETDVEVMAAVNDHTEYDLDRIKGHLEALNKLISELSLGTFGEEELENLLAID